MVLSAVSSGPSGLHSAVSHYSGRHDRSCALCPVRINLSWSGDSLYLFSTMFFSSLQDSAGFCAQDIATVLVGLSLKSLFAGVSLFTLFIVTTPLHVHASLELSLLCRRLNLNNFSFLLFRFLLILNISFASNLLVKVSFYDFNILHTFTFDLIIATGWLYSVK
jgi:hypothetical protein